MRKYIYILCFAIHTLTAFAQSQTQYNINGDEAMARLDYNDATMWYEVGVADCNIYSIEQLTKIWFASETMRVTMQSVMVRCLACLEDRAKELKDTVSINHLIRYYTEGIGTQADKGTAAFWREQLEAMTNPNIGEVTGKGEKQPLQAEKQKSKTDFFVGYSYIMLMAPTDLKNGIIDKNIPAGLKISVVGKNIGGYVRFNTNFSNQKYTEICDKNGIIEGLDGYLPLGNEKVNAMMITGGLVFKPMRKILVSIGGGYWKRELIYDFEKINMRETKSDGTFWAKVKDSSYEGAVLDLDGTYRIGKIFYVSAGGSFLNFKHACGNVGLGVVF
jgi:hypothetical protein